VYLQCKKFDIGAKHLGDNSSVRSKLHWLLKPPSPQFWGSPDSKSPRIGGFRGLSVATDILRNISPPTSAIANSPLQLNVSLPQLWGTHELFFMCSTPTGFGITKQLLLQRNSSGSMQSNNPEQGSSRSVVTFLILPVKAKGNSSS